MREWLTLPWHGRARGRVLNCVQDGICIGVMSIHRLELIVRGATDGHEYGVDTHIVHLRHANAALN